MKKWKVTHGDYHFMKQCLKDVNKYTADVGGNSWRHLHGWPQLRRIRENNSYLKNGLHKKPREE